MVEGAVAAHGVGMKGSAVTVRSDRLWVMKESLTVKHRRHS